MLKETWRLVHPDESILRLCGSLCEQQEPQCTQRRTKAKALQTTQCLEAGRCDVQDTAIDDDEVENAADTAGAEAVQAKLAEYQKRVAVEGELTDADVAQLESMIHNVDKDENQWQVLLS